MVNYRDFLASTDAQRTTPQPPVGIYADGNSGGAVHFRSCRADQRAVARSHRGVVPSTYVEGMWPHIIN